MPQLITLNTWVDFTVSHLELFNESAEEKTYEYHITLDSSVAHSFFEKAQYKQTTERNDAYEVDNITLSDTANIAENEATMTHVGVTASMGIKSGNLPVGDRIVEILALKLFGNARAKAAIANDTVIASTPWKSALEIVFDADRNLIFEQYVGLDRIETPADGNGEYNDTSDWQNFNFSGITFEIPVHLSLGDIVADGNEAGSNAPSSSTLSTAAKTGPVYGSSTSIVNGKLNDCPIKLTLTIA